MRSEISSKRSARN